MIRDPCKEAGEASEALRGQHCLLGHYLWFAVREAIKVRRFAV